MYTVTKLFKIFGVSTNVSLAKILGVGGTTISNWKKTGVSALGERKINELIREMGIMIEGVTNRDNGVSATGNGTVVINGASDPYLPTVMELWHHWTDKQKQDAIMLLLQFNKEQGACK